jgi:hypothetical protein
MRGATNCVGAGMRDSSMIRGTQLVGVGKANERVEVWQTLPTGDTEIRLNVAYAA